MPRKQIFQYILWDAANICNTGAICWNKTGDGVIINLEQFEKEYLGRSNTFCKSSKVTSFVRQLNLYGFKKTQNAWKKGQKKQHEFRNPWFVRDRRDLLDYINLRQLKAERKDRKYKEATATNNEGQRGRPIKAIQDTSILGEDKEKEQPECIPARPTLKLSQDCNSTKELCVIKNSEKENHFVKEPDTYKSLQEAYTTDCEISDEYLAIKAAYLKQKGFLSSVRACSCQNFKRNIFSFL